MIIPKEVDANSDACKAAIEFFNEMRKIESLPEVEGEFDRYLQRWWDLKAEEVLDRVHFIKSERYFAYLAKHYPPVPRHFEQTFISGMYKGILIDIGKKYPPYLIRKAYGIYLNKGDIKSLIAEYAENKTIDRDDTPIDIVVMHGLIHIQDIDNITQLCSYLLSFEQKPEESLKTWFGGYAVTGFRQIESARSGGRLGGKQTRLDVEEKRKLALQLYEEIRSRHPTHSNRTIAILIASRPEWEKESLTPLQFEAIRKLLPPRK